MTQTIDAPLQLWRLREFIGGFARLLDQKPAEDRILCEGGALLRQLVSTDDWLPAQYAQPDPQRYRQFLLHADSGQRFSVVSFVWGPGQSTPVHDHTVWGLVGMLRGAEYSQSFGVGDGALAPLGEAVRLEPGAVEAISPNVAGLHDVHQVRNAFADQTSISIHVYGANIGGVRRSVYQPDGTRKLFVSGYSNSTLPNIWDLSAHPASP
jgi:predicted metal-dependent enzyme (double-stranded beta helix superfamily)